MPSLVASKKHQLPPIESSFYSLYGHPYLVLLGFFVLCFSVAIFGALITSKNIKSWYATLNHPPGTPPDWFFAPVWTILYALMAISAWRIWHYPNHTSALKLWFVQLAFNALWTPVFFGLHQIGLAIAIIIILDLIIIQTIDVFAARDGVAALLLIPYLLWNFYATYLNVGTWWLNH
jgi:tryptophan-rich sensory protein